MTELSGKISQISGQGTGWGKECLSYIEVIFALEVEAEVHTFPR